MGKENQSIQEFPLSQNIKEILLFSFVRTDRHTNIQTYKETNRQSCKLKNRWCSKNKPLGPASPGIAANIKHMFLRIEDHRLKCFSIICNIGFNVIEKLTFRSKNLTSFGFRVIINTFRFGEIVSRGTPFVEQQLVNS